MSQDIVADGLNCVMNAHRAKKEKVVLKKHSKFLQQVLAIGKLKGYISEYRVTPEGMEVTLGKLNMCRAVKPRYVVKTHEIDKYVRRYLPSRNLGIIVVSTNKGIMTHHTATEKGLGGCIIAYFY